jgi:hypothetical protein
MNIPYAFQMKWLAHVCISIPVAMKVQICYGQGLILPFPV